jgi:2-phospho-L-lactate guanylyltransferase
MARWPSGSGRGSDVAVLVPMKGFAHAKERLSQVLAAETRVRLVKQMAQRVLEAACGLPVSVVCDDPEVASWAEDHGASVVLTPGRGLNGAVGEGVRVLASRGALRVLVAHADLPLATDLTALIDHPGVTLVPDRRGDGTNVVCLPTGTGFRFAYGRGSFARHAREAYRVGLGVRVVREPLLAWDVDGPADLRFTKLAPAGLAQELLPS